MRDKKYLAEYMYLSGQEISEYIACCAVGGVNNSRALDKRE